MPSFGFILLTAFSLVFVIEGLLYALFPDSIKRIMAMALSIPVQQMRLFGLLMATSGALMVYFLKSLSGS